MLKSSFTINKWKRNKLAKAGEADRLFTAVADFLASKSAYRKAFVPYKLNVLLHGLPGSGKTSIISAVASELGLNVAIVPFSAHLTDDALANAISTAQQHNCRLLALEDVDCLFEQRRKGHDADQRCALTLSGLLNCMDGMLRSGADGTLMFLTANLTAEIDEAVLRSTRIDVRLAFTYADEFQARACLTFYAQTFGWPAVDEQAWATFWDGVHFLRFSTATLQQFFFGLLRPSHQQPSSSVKPALVLSVDDFKALVRSVSKEGMADAATCVESAQRARGLYA